MAKIMISVPDDVLEKVTETYKEMGLNRSAFFTMCASEYINARSEAPKIRKEIESSRKELEISFGELISALNEKFK